MPVRMISGMGGTQPWLADLAYETPMAKMPFQTQHEKRSGKNLWPFDHSQMVNLTLIHITDSQGLNWQYLFAGCFDFVVLEGTRRTSSLT